MMMRCVKNVMRVASTVLDVVQTEGRRGQTRLHHPPPPGSFDVLIGRKVTCLAVQHSGEVLARPKFLGSQFQIQTRSDEFYQGNCT